MACVQHKVLVILSGLDDNESAGVWFECLKQISRREVGAALSFVEYLLDDDDDDNDDNDDDDGDDDKNKDENKDENKDDKDDKEKSDRGACWPPARVRALALACIGEVLLART